MNSKIFKTDKFFNLKNKIVFPPMTRCLCTNKGLPTKKLLNYYINRAKNNYGLIIIESAAINNNNALAYKNGLQFHNLQHLEKWSKILKKLKSYNCKVIIQLYHAGRLTVKELTRKKVVSLSSIKPENQVSFWRRLSGKKIVHFQTKSEFKKPVKLKINEIKKIEQSFISSIKLAIQAGFDGVELHGAHGYLLHSFLDGRINKRSDIYNYKDLLLFKNILSKSKKYLSNKIFSFRISLHRLDNSFVKYESNFFDIKKIIKKLDKYGINVFHSSEIKAGRNLFGSKKSLTQLIRGSTKKPIIVCGSIKSHKQISLLIKQGANLFAFGRSAFANKKFTRELKSKLEFKNNFYYKYWKTYS